MPTYNHIHLVDGSVSPAGLIKRGPIVPVEIHIPTELADHLLKQGKPVPQPVSGACLVDTGTGKTAVDDAMIQSLGVAPIKQD